MPSEIFTDPNSGLQIVFSLTFTLSLTTDLFSGEKILSRVCLHYFSIPSTENFVRNETLQIYYGASVRISAFYWEEADHRDWRSVGSWIQDKNITPSKSFSEILWLALHSQGYKAFFTKKWFETDCPKFSPKNFLFLHFILFLGFPTLTVSSFSKEPEKHLYHFRLRTRSILSWRMFWNIAAW